MRHLLVLIGVALAAAASAAAASAAKPLFVGPTPTADFVVADSCPFPVLVHNLVNNQVAKVFGDGSVIVTGSLKDRVTNLSSGKSIELDVSGPSFHRPNADGTTTHRYEGLTEFYPPRGALGPGSPGEFLVVAGTLTVTTDAHGDVVGLSRTGGVVADVCAALG